MRDDPDGARRSEVRARRGSRPRRGRRGPVPRGVDRLAARLHRDPLLRPSRTQLRRARPRRRGGARGRGRRGHGDPFRRGAAAARRQGLETGPRAARRRLAPPLRRSLRRGDRQQRQDDREGDDRVDPAPAPRDARHRRQPEYRHRALGHALRARLGAPAGGGGDGRQPPGRDRGPGAALRAARGGRDPVRAGPPGGIRRRRGGGPGPRGSCSRLCRPTGPASSTPTIGSRASGRSSSGAARACGSASNRRPT